MPAAEDCNIHSAPSQWITLGPVNAWERVRGIDRRLSGLMRDEGGRFRWGVWAVVAAWFLLSAAWNLPLGRYGIAMLAAVVMCCFALLALRRRRDAPSDSAAD
jgi:hypothetical protein